MFDSMAELKEYIDEVSDDTGVPIVTFDGLDDCIVGVAEQFTKGQLVVYDRQKMVEHFVEDGMTEEEAEEWICFNIEGLWAGEGTPLIMKSVQRGE